MKRHHNYPKTRKNRDTSYACNTKLIQAHGLARIKRAGTKYGMYKSGQMLGISPYVIRHIVHTNKWKRSASKAPFILKGVQRGKMPADFYKSLDFTGVTLKHKNRGAINAKN